MNGSDSRESPPARLRFAGRVSVAMGCAVIAVAARGGVVINEIHYDPVSRAELVEFIELHNAGTNQVDLTGWYFSSGVSYAFPNNTRLDPDEYLVVGESPAAVDAKFGISGTLGPFIGHLAGDGESVTLRNAAGGREDEVSYGDGFPWPVGSRGEGSSMELIHPSLDNDLGGSWRCSGYPAIGSPTPGARNSVWATNAPPQVRQVDHSPNVPTNNQPIRVTAKVTDPDGVAGVALEYQVVLPGAFIPAELPLDHATMVSAPQTARTVNPDFINPSNWTSVAMLDDGQGDDAAAGDGIFTVVIPGQINRALVRYRITPEDALAESERLPYADDLSRNFALFVYDGVPPYEADTLTVQGTGAPYTYGTNVTQALPVYFFITRNADVYEAHCWEGLNKFDWGSEAQYIENWEAALVYDGKVYDHMRYRLRGANGRYHQEGKRSMRWRFNEGNRFQARDIWGKKMPRKWLKMNTAKMFGNKQNGNFGLVELVDPMLYEMVGVPGPRSQWFHFRVVDGVDEAPAGPNAQYYGDFWGLGMAVECYYRPFMEARNMPDGNLYKLSNPISGGVNQRRVQGRYAPTNAEDYNNYRSRMNPARTEAELRELVNVDKWVNWRSVVEAIDHNDFWRFCDKNMAWFFEPVEGNPYGRLWYLPYDYDDTWGPHWNNRVEAMDDAVRGGDDKPNIDIELRNAYREMLDLVWRPEVINTMLDDLAAKISAFVPADRDRWRNAPSSQGYQDYGTMEAKLQSMKDFAFVHAAPYGQASRTRLQGLADAGNDVTSIPDKPALTYVGPGGYPINALTFTCSAYSDPQSDPFAAMRWRIGEITDTNSPTYDPTDRRLFEMPALYETGDITNYDNMYSFPSGAVKVGHLYRARVRMKDSTGRWSYWSDPVEFTAGPSGNSFALTNHLCISEVMYNPPGGSEYEFVELHNTSESQTLDLNGVRFTQGIDYTLGSGETIPPGGYLLVVRADPSSDFADFRSHYGLTNTVPIRGPYVGKLDDGGEELHLKTSSGGSDISSFTYDDTRGWPLSADGCGHSLVPLTLINQAAVTLDWPGNWRASAYMGGSPGTADPQPVGDLFVNEIVAHTDVDSPPYDSNDAIELYNATDAPVALAGWYLSDDPLDLMKWAIPGDAVIAANGWLTFDEMTGFHNPITSGFGLNKGGEQVFLSHLPGSTNDRVADAITFKGQENGPSLGRYPDGAPYLYALTPTTNAANALPGKHLIINELMVHPPATAENPEDNTHDEYIKIYNPTAGQVDLWNETGTWRIDGGAEFLFPPNTSLAARDALLVVPFDPSDTNELATFREAYGVTNAQGTIIGPFTGKLSNRGERIALERPQAPDFPSVDISWVIVDEVIYSTVSPWPAAVHTNGLSLQRTVTDGSGNAPENWSVLVANPDLPPAKISVISPVAGSTLKLPMTTTVSAFVDSGQQVGDVQSVVFYLNSSNVIDVVTAPPYETKLDYTHVPHAGTYRFRADMIDDSGTNSSVEITFYAENADRVHIVEPLDKTQRVCPFTQLIRVTVDPEHILGSVSNVSIYAGTNLLFTDTTAPYEFLATQSDLPPTRWHDLRATVLDDFGPTTSKVVRFYSYDSVWSNAAYRMKIHFPGYQGEGALKEFPVAVTFSEGIPGFSYSQASPSGADLRFADQTGTNILYHEIENWDTNGSSAVWVRLPELLTGTWIWAYWGDPGATLPSYATDGTVWTNYSCVLHLAGSSGAPALDSSPQALAATFKDLGFPTWSWGHAGVIGKTAQFSYRYTSILLGSGVNLGPEWTLSSWFKDLDNQETHRVLSETTVFNSPAMVFQGSDALGAYFDPGQNKPCGYSLSSGGGWRQLTAVGDTAGTRYFIDGQEVGSITNRVSGILKSAGNRSTGFASNRFATYIDEFRISRVARSAKWIATSWLNQASNGTFVTYGPAERQNPSAEPVADSDGDGMLDAWEEEHLGGVSADPNADADKDGMLNIEEFIAGTVPTNALSLFDLSVDWSNGQLNVMFSTIDPLPYGASYRRYYSLQNATNLLIPVWRGIEDYTNVPGLGQPVIYTNSTGAAGGNFRGQVWLTE